MKKFLAVLLAALFCFSFAACTGPAEQGNQNQNQGQNQGQNPPDDGKEDGKDDKDPPSKEKTVDELVTNFWDSERMYEETVMLVAETDENGNVIAAPKAKLLFEATEIESLVWYYSGSDNRTKKIFAAGTDYEYKDGALVAIGEIVDNDFTGQKEFRTAMPYVTDKMLSGEAIFPGVTGQDIPSKQQGANGETLYLPFTETTRIVQNQMSVTYKHAKTWKGATPVYYGADKLQRTVEKLKAKEKVELFLWGDSISTGANSSGYLDIPPFYPTWPELVAANLAQYYGTTVNLTNKAVGGWTTNAGVSGGSGWVDGVQIAQVGLEKMLTEELSGYKPDIAILAFGMNDATKGIEVGLEGYYSNLMKMIEVLRTVNPECDIILVGTMLANPLAANQSYRQKEYTDSVLPVIVERTENVCMVDIGAMHEDILGAGKIYTEISSNNVNHPNDFMARVYAMNLLSALIDYHA